MSMWLREQYKATHQLLQVDKVLAKLAHDFNHL